MNIREEGLTPPVIDATCSGQNDPDQMTAIPERTAPVERISGLIERVTFFNEETGFCVLRSRIKGHREEVTGHRIRACRQPLENIWLPRAGGSQMQLRSPQDRSRAIQFGNSDLKKGKSCS